MNINDLQKYIELNEKFLDDCTRIKNILKLAQKYNEYNNIKFANTFYLQDKTVYWEGDEHWNYGGYAEHFGEFPVEYLAMTDEELMNIVQKDNEKYHEEFVKKQQEIENKEKIKRFNQYQKLKKEFDN